ncbi:MAG: IucA/IucC family protein, partial [Gammaproteobacteria bacterium]
SDWLCTIRARDGFLRGSGLIFLREFAAQRNAVYQQSMLDRECTAVFTVKAPQGLVTDDDFLLIPSHPWQARWLLRVPVMVEAKRDGRMRHLGAQGELYYPTASVRMLYQAGNPYFYKFSLHVRLTNFGRKNAVYERENLTPEASAEQWFSRNVQQVMYPVLYCYFAHGVVFEPHLQNVIIGLVDNWPTQVCLRDFEGVKPDRERFPTTALFGILIKAGQLVFAIVQGHSHPFRVVPVACWQQPYSLPAVSQCRVTIAGQLCTPKDILASEVPVDQLRIGDLLLFPYAGAYAWHISHHDFLRHPHPQHIYLPVANQAYSS